MKTIKNLVLMFTLFTLTSCAPKVITDIVKTYPVTTTPENVRLFGLNDTVPNSAEVIGKVAVVDNGASTNCKYDQVLALAKKETAKNGGNALALTDHKEPSFWGSSCHQIAGMMLNLNDTVINHITDGQPNSFLEAKEIRKEQERRMRPTAHTIYANIGYAWITSKYYLPSGASGSPKNGLDWQIGYEWVSKSGFGCGLLYSGYRSSYDMSNNKINVGLNYIAPQFVLKQKVSEKWQLREVFGLGYFGYKESLEGISASVSGLGFNFALGAEYLLSNHVGIGANIGYIGASLPDQENSYNKSDDEKTGIFRLAFDAGIRFYF